MTQTVASVMRLVRNYFVTDFVSGFITITNGTASPGEIFSPGAWVAVKGAGSQDGVYQLDTNGRFPFKGEVSFNGTIYLLAPTADFLDLCQEIKAWRAAHPDPTLKSEKFGAYSHAHSSSKWETIFAASLAPYRRMFPEVTL